MLKVVGSEQAGNKDAAVGSLLDELVRDGARQMLAAALSAEVAGYVDRFADVVDGGRAPGWWSATATTLSGT